MDLTKTQAFIVFMFALTIIGISVNVAQAMGHNGMIFGAAMSAVVGIAAFAIGRGFKKGGAK